MMNQHVVWRRWLAAAGLCFAWLEALAAEPAHTWRFDFGAGPAAPGWTQVAPGVAFTPERGYGFDLGTTVESVDRGGDDALRGDLVTGQTPFFFSVPVPEGNYDVAVTFGDRTAGSTNTVKAESRRLLLERVVTQPGEFVTRVFTVNVRTTAIPGGSPVRLKDRENGVLHWDNKLTLEFNGARPAVCALEIKPSAKATTVFLLGDSTVTDQPNEPWSSWGQMLPRFFEPGVAIANHAESGESLRSSLNARRVEKVLRALQPGDYVLVQFGHNDQKDRSTNALAVFQTSLRQLVAAVRARSATPVLIASMERKSGARNNTLAGYPDAVRAVAREEGVPFINLQRMSQALYLALGTDLDLAFVDGTHHNAFGSYELARCVVEGLRQNNLPVALQLTDDLPLFDPRKPDSSAEFAIPASPQKSETKPDGD
jgi:lysophospholipase L1-like esterase